MMSPVPPTCFRCGLEIDRGRLCEFCRKPCIRKEPSINPELSFRDKQVCELVSQAKTNKEIAYLLHLTEGTIKEYLNRIFKKMGAKNRTELAIWWLMIHNRGSAGNVVDFSRLTNLGLEPPPNDVDSWNLPQMSSALGGRTAPVCGGGGIPPQNTGVTLSSAAPPDRQKDYANDGGSMTGSPAPSIRKQENQKGVAGAVGQWRDAKVFEQ